MRIIVSILLCCSLGTAIADPPPVTCDSLGHTIALVPRTTDVAVDPGATRKRAALVAVIAGGALWIAANQLGWYEKSQWTKYRDPTSASFDPVKADAAVRISRYDATGLFLAGTASLATAAYLYFSAPRSERVRERIWVPAISPDQVGVAVAGGF